MTYNFGDKLIISFDSALKTLLGNVRGTDRSCPSLDEQERQWENFSYEQNQQSIAQMRINHTGEVCAQALYHAQILLSDDENINHWLLKAAREEQDHLLWCAKRLDELDGRPSYLNPFFYSTSFLIGATLSALSPAVNLGFIRASEDLVCEHLVRQHGYILFDKTSRAIIRQMITDETEHSTQASQYGGVSYSPLSLEVMRLFSSVMKISVTVI